MRPLLHPFLVNGRFGDPALFVETLHQRSALLFDMGDLTPLSARDLLRVSHAFISHTHIDHFIGFDSLLRVAVGREKRITMVGPAGFTARLYHKLQGYEWDLVDRYDADLVFDVYELFAPARAQRTRFRFKNAFQREQEEEVETPYGIVAEENGFRVEAAILDHHGPCLGFAVVEPAHATVWKNRLDERGLPTGQWLQALKRAVIEDKPDEQPIMLADGSAEPLGTLRDLVTISQGQKIAYVTDVADTPRNRAAIAKLAEGADTLFIESRFAAEDAEQAQQRAHLTTTAAGEIARAAGVRKVEPFHFSQRYAGEEERMLTEVAAAFHR
ncbi:MAG: MBL fold metallo-hydrolase [Pseudomonadota bacterium]|nr:MBL fold metallo-hydrolase [Pseudomonadota bacterium]